MPRKTWTFFIDRNVTSILRGPLEESGHTVIRHQELYPETQHQPEDGDAAWLEEAGRNGWVVFTADASQRHKFREAKATKRYRVAKFILRAKGCKRVGLKEIIAKALPRIEQFLLDNEPPFVAKITKDGKVERYPEWM